MVNHVRTWLANLAPLSGVEPGEEHIPAAFVPVPSASLGAEVSRVRRALFGSNPSRDAVNTRVAILMAIVHSSPLVSHVTAKDTRITYLPDGSGIYLAGLSEADREFDLAAAMVDLAFLNDSSSRFFDGVSDYKAAWSDPDDLFRQVAAVVLTLAHRMELAGATAQ